MEWGLLCVQYHVSCRLLRICHSQPPITPHPFLARLPQIQSLLALCGEHVEVEEGQGWKAVHQSAAVLGVGLIAQSEELGTQMAHRALEHLLQYGEPPVRCGVGGAGGVAGWRWGYGSAAWLVVMICLEGAGTYYLPGVRCRTQSPRCLADVSIQCAALP